MKHRDVAGQGLLFDADRHCYRCGRRLRGEESIARGYGRRCWQRRTDESRSSSYEEEESCLDQ